MRRILGTFRLVVYERIHISQTCIYRILGVLPNISVIPSNTNIFHSQNFSDKGLTPPYLFILVLPLSQIIHWGATSTHTHEHFKYYQHYPPSVQSIPMQSLPFLLFSFQFIPIPILVGFPTTHFYKFSPIPVHHILLGVLY